MRGKVTPVRQQMESTFSIFREVKGWFQSERTKNIDFRLEFGEDQSIKHINRRWQSRVVSWKRFLHKESDA